MDPFFTEEPRLVPEKSDDAELNRLTVTADDRVQSQPGIVQSPSPQTPPNASLTPADSDTWFDGRLATLVACTLAIFGCVLVLPESLFTPLNTTAAAVVGFGGPWLMALATVSAVVLVALSLTSLGARRIGSVAQPHVRRASWTLLVIAAGLGSGILTWSVAEPMFHLQMNPLIDGDDAGIRIAAARSLAITWLHWGFHYWATVALMALVFSQIMFRPPARYLSHAVALLIALLITGLAASIVISIRNVVPGLLADLGTVSRASPIAGSIQPVSETDTMSLIMMACVALALLLTILPRHRGLKLAATASVLTMAVCFAAVSIDTPLIADPSLLTLAIDEYWRHVAPAFPFGELLSDSEWTSLWSGYYASWWWLLCPLPAFFIAHISRGRTIRDLIFTIIVAGGVVTFAWTALIGGSALVTELTTQQFAASVRLDIAASIPSLVDATVEAQWRPVIKIVFVLLALFLLLTNLATSVWAIASHYATTPTAHRLISAAVLGLVILLCLLMSERQMMARVDLLLVSIVPLVTVAFIFAAAKALRPGKSNLADLSAPSV